MKEEGGRAVLRCQECGAHFSGFNQLVLHSAVHHLACLSCGMHFASIDEAAEHAGSEHGVFF